MRLLRHGILLIACLLPLTVQAASVDSLTLINAGSNLPVAGHDPLVEGATIDLAVVGTTLNIAANVSGSPGKVNFSLSGAESHNQSEGVAPYALFGDSSGDFNAWTPTVGSYSLTVDADGGAAVTVDFTVTDSGSAGGGGGGGGGTSGAFIESGGLVVMEYEHASYDSLGEWGSVDTAYSGYTGDGYLEWKTGNDSTGIDSAGNGVLTWTVEISTAGEYQLHMRSRPSHSTEHNDVWIDFPDAAAYKVKSGSNQGALSGWTKMYNNGGGKWGWQTTTVDNDRHDIWVSFPSPGTYTFRCSGRSTKFAVDRIVLRHSAVATNTATDTSQPESERVGDGGGGDDGDGSVTIAGELKQWHRVDLMQAAVASSETADPNPFMDYRFNVLFTAPSGATYLVPGYFASDGQGGDAGNVWMAHLNPAETGTWQYAISFRSGSAVAVSLDANAGSTVAPFDGVSGSFSVAASDKSGDDFRAPEHGILVNRGDHYLTYGGSGKPFLYTGPGIPENILGYRGFTNTTEGIGHEFTAHAGHWNNGDPDWNNGAGKNLIGVLNYIADQGANCLYMMSNTIDGDGKDVFPHPTSSSSKDRYDLLKLQQWDMALGHAQAKGIFLHWHLAEHETGNKEYYGASAIPDLRKLYFRMMNARFGHYNGLKWNIMEETSWSVSERKAQMQYLKAVDPYDHPVTFQVGGLGPNYTTYSDHYGDPFQDSGSFQGSNSRSSMFNTVQQYRNSSAASGEPWTIAWDEPRRIDNDNTDENQGYPMGRRDKMWPCLMAGGDGFMWYIQKDGGGHGFDQRIEDFTIMQNAFNWSGHVRDFLEPLPLLQMQASMDLVESNNGTDYCLYLPGQVYAIYNDRAGTGMSLDLGGVSGSFDVRWFDPRSGGALQTGSVGTVNGGGSVDLGDAPSDTGQDWAVLVSIQGDVDTYSLSVGNGSGDGAYVEGAVVTITADAPPNGQVFAAWTGDTAAVADVNAATTTITMPASAVSLTATYTVPSQEPYGGTPHPIPGVVEVEFFDLGGAGVAYTDGDNGSQGIDWRDEDVDVQVTNDSGGGHNVGWIDNGEWLEYTVSIAQAGTYQVVARVASDDGGGAFHLEVDGTMAGTAQQFAATGGWQTWIDHHFSVELPAGVHVLRLSCEASGWNINHLAFSLAGRSIIVAVERAGTPVAIDALVNPADATAVDDGDGLRFDGLGSASDYRITLVELATSSG